MAYEFCVCVCNSVQCTEDERPVQYVKEKEKKIKEIKVVFVVPSFELFLASGAVAEVEWSGW